VANTEAEPPGVLTGGSVVLDIGGQIGAAIIRMSDHSNGKELEIRRTDVDWDGTHTGIRRGGACGSFAIFGSLAAGDYEIRMKGTLDPIQSLHVEGGEVSQVDWLGTADLSGSRV
jgi:hypothetical protein